MKIGYYLLAGVFMTLSPKSARADEITFQNGTEGYEGTRDVSLRGEPDTLRLNNYGGAPVLEVEGVPSDGIRRMSLIRFDDIVGTAPHQIPPGSKINSATLELYRVGSPENSGQYEAEPSWAKVISVYPMLVSYKTGDGIEGTPIEGAVSFSQRAFGGEFPVYWGNQRQLEDGPVADVDYDKARVVAAPYRADENDMWMTWNISEAVRQWVDNPESNHGLYMVAHGSWIGVQLASSESDSAELRPKLVIDFTPPSKR